jgi:purine nucleosidase
MSGALPVVLDTDMGNDPDDLLALAMILDRPEFDLRAVIATGKNPILRARFVRHLCKISGQEGIPVGVGSAPDGSTQYAIRGPSEFHTSFFRQNAGFDPAKDVDFPEAREILTDVMSPEVTLITIGPLTTLADFISENPSSVKNISRVVSMGGFISRKGKKYVKEYNFSSDPRSTRKILTQGFEHICVTKNICGRILMRPEHIGSAALGKSPARSFAFRFMGQWFKERAEKTLYDPFTAVFALEPARTLLKPVSFDIRDDGGCKGIIIKEGRRYATIGGTPHDLNQFNDIFYGGV